MGPLLTFAMEEFPYLFPGKAVARRLKSLVDAIGNGVSDGDAEEGCGGVGTVVPEGEGRLEMRQLDDRAGVKSSVQGPDAQHLCFGATCGRGVTRFSIQVRSTSAKRWAIWFQLVPLRALLDSPTSTTKRFKV